MSRIRVSFLAYAAIAPLALMAIGHAQEGRTVSAESIAILADRLPEFKTDPHVSESQGNQISGVVRTILQDSSGCLWFGTQNGLSRHDGTSLVYFDLKDEIGQGITVMALAEDLKGHLWIGSTGGLTKFDGTDFTTFAKKDGLKTSEVWSVFVDGQGLLWVGTLEGAYQFDGKTFTSVDIPAAKERDEGIGLWSPTRVWFISQDRGGNLWLAAESGLYKKAEGAPFSRFSVMEEQSKTHVTSVLESRNGDLWFSTRYKGVIRYDGQEFAKITEQDNLKRTVGNMFEDRKGSLWFSVKGLGVCQFDGESISPSLSGDTRSSFLAFCIREDTEGRIWLGGFGGVYRYDGKAFVNVTRDGPW